MGSPQSTNHLSGSPAVGDFNAELTKHLTLKKQKKQQQQQQQESNSPNESRNRGPPPQPPTKNPLTTVTDNNIRTAAQSNVVKQTNRFVTIFLFLSISFIFFFECMIF